MIKLSELETESQALPAVSHFHSKMILLSLDVGMWQNLGRGRVNFNEAKVCKGTQLGMKLSSVVTSYGFHFTKSIFLKVSFLFVCLF